MTKVVGKIFPSRSLVDRLANDETVARKIISQGSAVWVAPEHTRTHTQRNACVENHDFSPPAMRMLATTATEKSRQRAVSAPVDVVRREAELDVATLKRRAPRGGSSVARARPDTGGHEALLVGDKKPLGRGKWRRRRRWRRRRTNPKKPGHKRVDTRRHARHVQVGIHNVE